MKEKNGKMVPNCVKEVVDIYWENDMGESYQPSERAQRIGAIHHNLGTVWPRDGGSSARIGQPQHQVEQFLGRLARAFRQRDDLIPPLGQQPVAQGHLSGKRIVADQPVVHAERLHTGQARLGERVVGKRGLQRLDHSDDLAASPRTVGQKTT